MGFSSIAFLLTVQYAKKNLKKSVNITPESSVWDRIANVALRVFHVIPHILLVVVVGICVTYGLRLDKKGLKVLGDQPNGLPKPKVPDLGDFDIVGKYVLDPVIFIYNNFCIRLIEPALVMSIIGFVETMAVAKHYAAEKNYQVFFTFFL